MFISEKWTNILPGECVASDKARKNVVATYHASCAHDEELLLVSEVT